MALEKKLPFLCTASVKANCVKFYPSQVRLQGQGREGGGIEGGLPACSLSSHHLSKLQAGLNGAEKQRSTQISQPPPLPGLCAVVQSSQTRCLPLLVRTHA